MDYPCCFSYAWRSSENLFEPGYFAYQIECSDHRLQERHWVSVHSQCIFRLTVPVLMLDIETEWTLNALLTTSSSYRKCSKRRTLDHSAQATSRLPIGCMMKRSPTAHGFGSGSPMASVAEPSLQCSD